VTNRVNGMMNLYGEGNQSGIKNDADGRLGNYYYENGKKTQIPGDLIIEGVGGNRGVDMVGDDSNAAIAFVSLTQTNSVRLTGKATGVGGVGIYNTKPIYLEFDIVPKVPPGNHLITGIATAAGGIGIYNSNKNFCTGKGDDIITGIGSAAGGVGIYNSGEIFTYQGNDTIDALTGGFRGNGKYELKEGNDTVKGFGIGKFDGGVGEDSLYLPSGSYQFDKLGVGQQYNIKSMATSETMFIDNFEKLYIGTSSWNFPLRGTQTLTG